MEWCFTAVAATMCQNRCCPYGACNCWMHLCLCSACVETLLCAGSPFVSQGAHFVWIPPAMVVCELLKWRAPMVLVFACLLLGFNPKIQQKED